MPDSRRLAIGLAVAGVLAATVAALLSLQHGPLLEQAWLNIRFADRRTLLHALERYPKTWPPLYPLLLRGWIRMGLAVSRLNLLLLYASHALLYLAARRIRGGVAPLALLALWAVAHFNYIDGHQPTADALVLPLLLLLYLLLLDLGGATRTRIAVALVTAALLVSRYFSLFGVLPLVALALVSVPGRPLRQRLTDLAAVGTAALLPLALWMAWSVRETGHLTGADRAAPRRFPEHLRYWSELTQLSGNLRMWCKTVFLDFLSTRKPAVLAFVTTDYEALPLEWLLGLLAAVAAATGAWAAASLALRRGAAEAADRARFPRLLRPVPLALAAFAIYNAALIAVWTVGNNDPLHSRYLWPAYPFLLLLFLAGREAVARAAARDFWPALPFRLLFALLFAVHLQRSLLVTSTPVRYELELEPIEAPEPR